MVDSSRYFDWLERGKKDLQGAQILFEHNVDNALVCFHCQQALEKYFKGYLLKKNNQLVEGHSLIKLCKLCEQYHGPFKDFLKDVALINGYYIETRYPADEPLIISNEETGECLEITKRIMEAVDLLII